MRVQTVSPTRYKVVLNGEEQYSIWPLPRDNPPGWRDEGTYGTREEGLDRIEAVWTDMRPRGVRLRVAALVA
nr:MbtH family protein [Streptomyces antimycoticus]